ncbi:hypothetical protein CEUSTIGMA_g280.t1 [Chlamydomonas eustigma]|uniref:Rad4 beta-hairpin domain-containing protein n=1 Tax=Chlamydomonas eustigma TaxID=1157962 RepID=A0A250WPQ0_9CHLO|nr:hypothetical protein CEUSTIGMA_g280.t1 [Chlamydomonas eustigma]|eukprot:GAX72825.1 hypothetical protein CEUSTIGMA_g280.t1 [Chlamydomonas eustigma]
MDIEWEDAQAEDWEVLLEGDDLVETQQVGIRIELEREDGTNKTVRKFIVNKAVREQCLALHRVHLLCLLGRTQLYNTVANDEDLQVRMLSLLPEQTMLLPNQKGSGKEVWRTILALRLLVEWFQSSFSVSAYTSDEEGHQTAQGVNGVVDSFRMSVPNPAELAMRAVTARAGPEEVLVALFVALVRSQGMTARYVRLLDVLPKEPWRKSMTRQVKHISGAEAQKREEAFRLRQKQMTKEGTGGETPSTKGETPGTKGGKKSLKRASQQTDNRKKKGQKSVERNCTESQVIALGQDQEETAAEGPSGSSVPGGRISNQATQSKLNRGEEEFEREMQLALMATAAEAEAKLMKSLSRSAKEEASGVKKQSEPSTQLKQVKSSLISNSRKSAKKSAGASGSTFAKSAPSSSSLPGLVSSSRSSLAPVVWAEVYCGSDEAGRWVHVDVINGLVDKPDSVEVSTMRTCPLAYVIACSPCFVSTEAAVVPSRTSSTSVVKDQAHSVPQGTMYSCCEVKDITSRYASSTLTVQRLRDDAWWTSLLSSLNLKSNPHGGESSSSTQNGRSLTAPMLHQSKSQPASSQGLDIGQSRQVASKAITNTDEQTAPRDRPTFSALRSKREDAELQQRSASHMQGLPATIEAFKSHPVYILKRHLTKYQALRPGSTLLGTHKGEPYYARSAMSDLHTPERWRREGREVRSDELDSPAKTVKKRLMPQAGSKPYSSGKFIGRGRSAYTSNNKQEEMEEDDEGTLEDTAGEEGLSGPTIDLFGDWQTEPWKRPAATDGIVPKNERGNVECPPLLPALPHGTVHLSQYPGIGGVCRSLGIDFAPALVGFEVQAGRMLPKIDGIVVCEEFECSVVSAYLDREAARQTALAERRMREAKAAWSQLLQGTLMRLQLQSAYEEDRKIGEKDAIDLTVEDQSKHSAQEILAKRLLDEYTAQDSQHVSDAQLGEDIEEF